jgi:hypothetical protein
MALEALISSPVNGRAETVPGVVMPSMSKWMVGLALVGLCGCASGKVGKKPEQAKAEAPAPEPIRPPPASNEKVTEKDTNGDRHGGCVGLYAWRRRGADGASSGSGWSAGAGRQLGRPVHRPDVTTARAEEQGGLAMDLDFDGKVDSVSSTRRRVKTGPSVT